MTYADYWAKRALEREAVYRGDSEKTIAVMQGVYNRAFENIKERIEAAGRQLMKKGGTEAPEAEAYLYRMSALQELQDKIYDECKRLENIERKVTAARYADVMGCMFTARRLCALTRWFA